MKTKLLATLIATAVGGLLLGGVTEAADVVEITVGGIPTLTICDENVSNYCISMMDRNMQAENNDITSTGSYGFLYRWGANGGGYSPFNAPSTWSQVGLNNDLWGDITKTLEARQGPCLEGYHVPTKYELNGLMDIWAGTTTSGSITNNVSQFLSDFKIPFVGYREGEHGNIQDFENSANIWSSTCNGEPARSLIINQNEAILSGNTSRHDALSVRCFKNEPVKFTATFVVNGADSIGEDELVGVSVIAPTITRDGGTVLGWSTDSGGTVGEYNVGDKVSLSGDITLYAITSKTVNATFNANGNKLDGQTENVEKNCTVYNMQTGCEITTPTISNTITQTIVGYSTSSEGTGMASIGSNENLTITGGEIYYAQTVTPSMGYTATFSGNGASVVEDTESCTTTPIYNGSTVVPSCTVEAKAITREGWEILGWSTNSGATEGEYNVGDEIGLSGDMTLYAITKRIYTVNFQENGAESIGASTGECEAYNTDIVCREKTAQSVSATRLIYNVGTDITICDPSNPTNCMTMMDRNLGADSNDATTTASYGNHYKRGNNNGVIWSASASTFSYLSEGSWAEGTQGPCPEDYHIPTATEWTTLLAMWKGSEGHLSTSEEVLQFNSDFKLPTAGRRSNGNNVNSIGNIAFLWTSTSTRQVFFVNISSEFSNIITSTNNYGNSIRCFKNTPSLPATASLKLPTITRDGWTVLGWSADSESTVGEYNVGDKLSLSGDMTLYAITSKAVSTTFNANGNNLDGQTENVEKNCTIYSTQTGCEITTPIISNTTTPTVVGYTTSSEGTGTANIGSNASLNIAGGEIYYAQTTSPEVTMTVEWESNGAVLEDSSDSICQLSGTYNGVAQATGCTVEAKAITRDGWTVLGWSTNSGATEGEYNVGDEIGLSGDMTLYAITKRVYTVNFQENGAESIGASTGECEAYNTDIVCREKTAQSVSATRLIYNVGTDITICDSSNPTSCITMMDRNLGADSNDTTTTASYGNHYKRGNNVGVIRSASSSTFGGISEGTQWTEGGQGPCPDGYHIPTEGEWTSLLAMWKGTNGQLDDTEVLEFKGDFKIPNGGRRSYGSNVNDKGAAAYLWSSTTRRFLIVRDTFSNFINNTNNYGNSIRCFKDTPSLPATASLKIPTIIRDGWTILGWSADSEGTVGEYNVGDKLSLSGDMTLYAITSKAVSATFNANGNNLDGQTENVEKNCTIYSTQTGCNITTPTISNTTTPTVVGYTTSSEGTGIASIESNTGLVIVGGETYYAQTKKDYDEITVSFDSNINGGTDSSETCTPETKYNGVVGGSCTVICPNITLVSGFNKIGWSTVSSTNIADACAENVTSPAVNSDTIYYASWIANDDTKYTVEYYKENLSGGYDVVIGVYTGTTNTTGYAQVVDFTGFTYDSGDINNITTGNIEGDESLVLKLYYTRNEYVITFDTDGGSTIAPITGKYGEPLVAPSNPSKPGFTFGGWTGAFPETMPYSGANLKALWNKVQGGSKGGGGTRIVEKDNCPNGDKSPNEYDGTCLSITQTGDTGTKNNTHGSASCSIENSTYTEELNGAYQYACKVGITTMDTIQKADMTGPLLRKHLAKMVSEFAMNELGMQPNTGKICKFNDMAEETQEMQKYAELACQLGFMGLYSDGIQVKDNFDPNDQVTRAEFGTVLSRLLWGTKYAANDGDLFYKKHLEALKKNKIMTQIYGSWPSSIELRGYVMLMLKRVSELEM